MVDATGSKTSPKEKKLGDVGLHQPNALSHVRQFRADVVNELIHKGGIANWDTQYDGSFVK